MKSDEKLFCARCLAIAALLLAAGLVAMVLEHGSSLWMGGLSQELAGSLQRAADLVSN
ncbi:hypothetical protein [Robiginitalea marina]|uniref:Uncharacterized protein n=1 Tax=Robiginitalea marina TaxID=2954105 RepID=A0ABT1B0L8_9FLAO|nr:hypothetical protein [Robiginitalea marina]MCO5725830.1 hypothetical protein [Robiginitalea marina]